jgi:hypothetical protein
VGENEARLEDEVKVSEGRNFEGEKLQVKDSGLTLVSIYL